MSEIEWRIVGTHGQPPVGVGVLVRDVAGAFAYYHNYHNRGHLPDNYRWILKDELMQLPDAPPPPPRKVMVELDERVVRKWAEAGPLIADLGARFVPIDSGDAGHLYDACREALEESSDD